MSGEPDCCAPSVEAGPACPGCGHAGRRVAAVTISAMDDDEVFPFDGARYCPTPACDVVYFHAEAGVVRVESVRVRVGQKESAPDRPVCYCFGFSAADIVANPEAVRRDITERCRRGRDRCREANPQGACCLGQVRAIALAAPPSSDPAER